mgnify:CR=1 FL=1
MEEKIRIKEAGISSLALAYLGDAVLEIHIRDYVLRTGKAKLDQLHRASVRYVCATAQSQVYEEIQPYLNKEELRVMKNGRNSKKKVPKNVTMKDYRKSTGLEALYGYLYLENQVERIKEITEIVIGIVEGRSGE